jgi:hypothetical protein
MSTKSVFFKFWFGEVEPGSPLSGAPLLQLQILQKTDAKVLLFVIIMYTNHIHKM